MKALHLTVVVLWAFIYYGVACGKKGPPLPPLPPKPPPVPAAWGIRCIGNACTLWIQGISDGGTFPVDEVHLVSTEDGEPITRWSWSAGRTEGHRWMVTLPPTSSPCVQVRLIHRRQVRPLDPVCLEPIRAQPIPPVPRSSPTPEGIVFQWDTPLTSTVEVYRREDTDEASSTWPWEPLAQIPAGVSQWQDTQVQHGGRYGYGFRYQWIREPHRWMASLTQVVEPVVYRDVFPPPAPSELMGYREDGRITLVWASVEAPDFRGYFVYVRSADEGMWRRLNEEPVSLARYEVALEAIPAGRVAFTVRAIDNRGNESPPSPVWWYVPEGVQP